MNIHPAASQAQLKASDPAATVWVNANAGSGKTHVLVDRVVRLMLGGTEPARIMCLTFTKAAAAEMANRLFERLSGWIAQDDDTLRAELGKLGVAQADAALLARARQLFTRALETPGGLKIQTIHAFCERVLQLFPVEAGVVPHFTMLDDRQSAALLAEARDAVLVEARHRSSDGVGEALFDVANRVDAENFDRILAQLLGKRAGLRHLLDEEDGLARAESLLRQHLGLAEDVTQASLESQLTLDRPVYDRFAAALDSGNDKDRERAEKIRWASASSDALLTDLADVYLTKKHEPRATGVATASVLRAHSWLPAFIESEQRRLRDGMARLGDLSCLTATLSLLRLGAAILARFARAKQARGAYDFDDLIIKTGELLRERPDAAWVLYKLDGGIEHLLVDEAQDTSPMQWQIIRSLTDEFFAGEGRHGAVLRTLFVVGDRKQSIYSFQGADPAVFETVLGEIRTQAEGAGQAFRAVDFSVSFRSTPEVLEAVDTVFAPASAARAGLDGQTAREWDHVPNRRGVPGVVEIWPLEAPGENDHDNPWQAPVDREPAHAPRRRLARQLAQTIRGWIGQRLLPARKRAVEPADILILVRQRNSFFDAMIRALWNEGVPVAGADRLRLGETLAVLDLVALAQFAIMPEDDHALACVLKSPILGRPLDEDELLRVAAARGSLSLWQQLEREAAEPFAAAAALLRPLIEAAPRARPFEFFAGVLNAARLRFLERLGSEANDAIDALLDRALDYEESHGTSLAGFVNWFQAEEIEIKRNMESGVGQVRVMTVHGAKGLEAPIVILPDTTGKPEPRNSDQLMMLPGGDDEHAKVPLWLVPNMPLVDAVGRLRQFRDDAVIAEHRRLLYVAMTRACDELYVCGYGSRRKLPDDCWYTTVLTALQGRMTPIEGDRGWRLGTEPVRVEPPAVDAGAADAGLPPWIRAAIGQVLPEAAGSRSPRRTAEGVTRGILIHRILQNLPDLGEAERPAYIAAAVRRAGADSGLAEELVALTSSPLLAGLLSSEGHSEAALITGGLDGRIERRRIDRLLVTPEAILVADYKTDRAVPASPADCDPDYLMQLAIYRDAMRLAEPGKPLRFCIVWTEVPSLMMIPDALLDRMAALRQPRP